MKRLNHFLVLIFHTQYLFNCEVRYVAAVHKDMHEFTTFHDEKQLKEGQLNYNLIIRDSQMPRYGSCWKMALKELEYGCKHLTDDVQRRLALRFTNCFLEKAGQSTYPCDADEDITTCLSSMTTNSITTFALFFTHTQSMCYFLQAQAWQEETESTVARLTENSHKVVKTLEDTSELQDAILEAQKKSLAQQELLLGSSFELGRTLDEFRMSTSEQRNLIFQVFDRLSKLQNLVLGEVSGFYSLIFYPTALLTAYLLTSTARTSGARFWLFVILGASLAVERCIVYSTVSDDSGYLAADEASKEMYCCIWMARKAAMLACVLLLAYYAYKFCDYNVVNNALLMQIQRQNLELKGYLESIGTNGISGMKLLSSDVIDFKKFKNLDETSDSEFSYDSDASDGTYIPSEDDTFETAYSRLSTTVPSPEYSMLKPASEVKKEIKTDRPSSRANNASRIQTPVTPQTRYNLRSRSGTNSLNSSIVTHESPETFGRIVKHMERITKNNARQIIETVKKSHTPSYFSSDDEH